VICGLDGPAPAWLTAVVETCCCGRPAAANRPPLALLSNKAREPAPAQPALAAEWCHRKMQGAALAAALQSCVPQPIASLLYPEPAVLANF